MEIVGTISWRFLPIFPLMDVGTVIGFWGVALLLILVPGADWAYAIGGGARGRVVAAVGGLLLGYVAMTGVTAAGVGAVVAASPTALGVLTLVGGGYLVWLGVRALLRPAAVGEAGGEVTGAWSTLARGAAVSGLNPKGLLLFVVVLPQFTDAASSWPVAGQVCVLGLVYLVACAAVYGVVATAARGLLRARPGAGIVLARVSGSAMVLVGGLLLAERAAGTL